MKRFAVYASIAMLLLVAFASLMPNVAITKSPATFVAAASNGRQYAFALNAYYSEHGTMPATLDVLPMRGLADDVDLRLIETKTRQPYDWLYLGEHYQGMQPSQYIVAASPLLYNDDHFSAKHTDGERLVVYADGHVVGMEEAEFQAAIERQLAQDTRPTLSSPAGL